MLFVSVAVYAVTPNNQNIENNHEQKRQELDKAVQSLNITNEQKQQMKQLMESDIAKRKELKEKSKEKMEAIDNELAKEKYDISVIENLVKEIEQINLEILKIKIDGKIKMRNILTREQFLRMEQHRKHIFGKSKYKHPKRK
jgi:Spy/CpxP family protein refolding chaperone